MCVPGSARPKIAEMLAPGLIYFNSDFFGPKWPKLKEIGSRDPSRSENWCLGVSRKRSEWTHWDLNPGPSACEADVIPLHHVPLRGVACLLLIRAGHLTMASRGKIVIHLARIKLATFSV